MLHNVSKYTEDNEEFTILSMRCCSRFETCSAPLCPLDILIDKRTDFPDNEKCGMAKATRHRYWQNMPDYIKRELLFQGYFEAEYNRMRSAPDRWNALSESKKAQIKERLRNARPR